ncbi:ABC transporter permease [Desulfogranum japonicum]|uniref:ABC transporter permease n=1 Tax=Desulfogranum japonicum TaxID=231447 RepID=UPI0004250296|nr:ABC transporter permease [Desulfogranum japonicum]
MIDLLRTIASVIVHMSKEKELLVTLIINDFRKQYLGSYLGLSWAFLQPLVFILVIWTVFEHGFKVKPVSDELPFFVWLVCGMVPWFFFSNSLAMGVDAITSNSFLVKKVSFRVGILPVVVICSEMIIHLGLILCVMVILMLYGLYPTLYWLQFIYYLGCQFLLLIGLTLLFSALRVFIKDMSNIISVMLQIGFWCTPIFWNSEMLSPKHQIFIKINPLYYIINGYRETFTGEVWFWHHYKLAVFFFCISFFFIIIGSLFFKRLRPHFGDVL